MLDRKENNWSSIDMKWGPGNGNAQEVTTTPMKLS